MGVIFVLFVLTVMYDVRIVQPRSLKIETRNGRVLGKQMSSGIYSWRGIPYAKPPLGDLRFEPPQEPSNWAGTWNATYDRNSCVSALDGNGLDALFDPVGDEDCLYINVYTSKLPKRGRHLKPVMVWIYGGAFIGGASRYDLYGPDQLVSEDVIFVSFNYRLGILGFLSTEDDVAPGNNGLRDQILALKWVKANIKAFGGDPDQVTIFGESAGAASVSYLTLSPLTGGLFQRGIMQSGTALCLWALSKTSREAAFSTGAILGIATLSSRQLIDQLKRVPARNLQLASVKAMGTILETDPLNGLVFAPVIEPASATAVISEYTYEKLKLGQFHQVPVIMGYNSAEAYFIQGLVQLLASYLAGYDLAPARLVPNSMNADSNRLLTIGTRIKIFYAGLFGKISFPNDNFLRYFSDNEFVRPIQVTANLVSQYTNIYFYKFSYTSDSGAVGAAHGDDLRYLFNSPYNSTSDTAIKSCLIKTWTAFAATGYPSSSGGCGGIDWQPMGPNHRDALHYVNIDRTVTRGRNPDPKNMTFWYKQFDLYGKGPYVTY